MARELTEKHKQAMQAGRQKKIKARAAGAEKRVAAYIEWANRLADAAQGEPTREALRSIKRIEIPSDADFRIVRGEED